MCDHLTNCLSLFPVSCCAVATTCHSHTCAAPAPPRPAPLSRAISPAVRRAVPLVRAGGLPRCRYNLRQVISRPPSLPQLLLLAGSAVALLIRVLVSSFLASAVCSPVPVLSCSRVILLSLAGLISRAHILIIRIICPSVQFWLKIESLEQRKLRGKICSQTKAAQPRTPHVTQVSNARGSQAALLLSQAAAGGLAAGRTNSQHKNLLCCINNLKDRRGC